MRFRSTLIFDFIMIDHARVARQNKYRVLLLTGVILTLSAVLAGADGLPGPATGFRAGSDGFPAIATGFRAGSDGHRAIANGFRAGGGAGASVIRQQLEGEGYRSAGSFMIHTRLEYGGRFRYVGRFSYGIPFHFSLNGERQPIDQASGASASADTFQGAAVVFSTGGAGPEERVPFAFIPAIGGGANLTHVRIQDQAQGPAPVTAAGPAAEATTRVLLGDRVELGISLGAMLGLLTVDMAENSYGPSGVSSVLTGHLSPELIFSF